jgi:PAS domain S-box-containing protein
MGDDGDRFSAPGNFELLARLCPDGVLVADDGAIAYANPAAGRLLGMAPEQLLGRPVLDLAAPGQQERLRQRLHEASGGVFVPLEETQLRGGSGDLVDTETTCGPARCGARPAAQLLIHDISERKRAATRLRASDSQLAAELAEVNRLYELSARLIAARDLPSALDEVLDAAIALLDADYGNIQLYNPGKRGLEIVVHRGLPQAFLDFFRLVRADDDSACGQALRSGSRIVIEDVQTDEQYVSLRGIAASAGYRAVQSTPLVTAGGEILGMLSTHFRSPHCPSGYQLRMLDLYAIQAVELVDRLRKEQALRESGERFRRALSPRNVGIVFLDNSGAVHEANDAFLQMSGYARADVGTGALHWIAMTPPERRAGALRAIAEFRRTGKVAPCEHEYVRKDGSRWSSLCSVTRIGEDEGVGYMIDISNLKRAEQALKEADRRKDEFLATLAHELRNPLAPICNALVLLQPHDQQRRRADRLVEMVQRQVRHIVRLVDDLLEVSRITRGKIKLRRAPVELAEVLRHAVEASLPLIEARHQHLHVATPDAPVTLDADGVRLTQVVANLLNNAAKYTGDGGDIWLDARGGGQEAVVSVRDNGMGMSRDMLPRVFEMFVQGEPGGIDQGGLGIGLTMVRKLVELHEGSIEARSEGPGRGAEFIVRLPLAPPCAAQC